MRYILTNGKDCYIKMSNTGGVAKAHSINNAKKYSSIEEAKEVLNKAPSKTRGYYIQELETNIRYKYSRSRNRLGYPKEVREIVYNNAEGRCALCGKKITYKEMTLDHIIPIAMNGDDNVKNLQCTCEACNKFKGSALPQDFWNRITEIFTYQTETKTRHPFVWKITRRLLKLCIE